jgi:hypothetical protein
MREELNESLEHFRMAAAHAAGGAAHVLAPRLDEAKKAASTGVDTLRDAARDGARQANTLARKDRTKMKKKTAPRRRWPALVSGLLVVGAAAGAVGALFSRRRTRQRWNEYGTPGTGTDLSDDARSMLDSAKTAMDSAKDKAAQALGTASEKLGRDTAAMSENVGQTRPPDLPKGNTLGQYSGQTSGTTSKNSRP